MLKMKSSGLYKCRVMHNRKTPAKNVFHYDVFMFWLDLDHIDSIAKKNFFISRNRFNVFSFRDKDHFFNESGTNKRNLKAEITDYLKENNISTPKSIKLLTNLSTFGYQFNPVSFYFCYDHEDNCYSCIVEVSNTFREMKMFPLNQESFSEGRFEKIVTKHFYVSPFIDHDVQFHFRIQPPAERLNIRIDDIKDGDRFFVSTLTGEYRELTNARLFWYSVRFPFITVKIISLIHWQAARLWLKKIKHHKKEDFPELQKDVLRKYKKNV